MQYRGVIFDLDGTLVDSVEDLADSLNGVLENHNFPIHSIETYKMMIGSGVKKLVYDALPAEYRDGDIYLECVEDMYEVYASNCLNKTHLYDGVNSLLDELDSMNIKYSILSNKADEFTKSVVSTLFPNRKFEFVVGVTKEEEKKPNPKNALSICKDMGLTPDQILYLGDSGIDMQTASSANMYAVGALWGFKSREEMELNGADCFIDTPLELAQIIKKI